MARINRKRKPAPAARRHRKPQPQRAPQRAIIVRTPNRDWSISPEEAIILKNAICKGATDTEFQYCMTVARHRKLNPFKKQIHFVPRWDREAESTDGEKGGKVWVPVVAIDGLLHLAARDHADYGSIGEPEYGPMMDLSGIANRGTKYAKPFKIKVPEWCRVEIRGKNDPAPTVAKVWWEEIYPDVSFSPTVRKMPRLMIAKCTVAQGVRKRYPETGGLYIPEELEAKREFQGFTREGRIIAEVLPSFEGTGAAEVDPALESYQQREKEAFAKLPAEAQERIRKQRERSEAQERNMQASRASEPNPLPALFYKMLDAQRYLIDGNPKLMHDHRELLIPLWKPESREVIADPKQLGHLIRQFELKKVPFKALERQPGE